MIAKTIRKFCICVCCNGIHL